MGHSKGLPGSFQNKDTQIIENKSDIRAKVLENVFSK